MPKSKKEITKNDRKILNALIENARQSMIEISEKTGLSRQTIQKTILKLEKNHAIWGYQAIFDEQKNGLKEYLILIKRTTKPVNEKIVDKVILAKTEEAALKMGIKYITSLYTHGSYDLILIFMASDFKDVKKFIEYIKSLYTEYFADVQILESLFTIRRQGILNPDVNDLKQFM